MAARRSAPVGRCAARHGQGGHATTFPRRRSGRSRAGSVRAAHDRARPARTTGHAGERLSGPADLRPTARGQVDPATQSRWLSAIHGPDRLDLDAEPCRVYLRFFSDRADWERSRCTHRRGNNRPPYKGVRSVGRRYWVPGSRPGTSLYTDKPDRLLPVLGRRERGSGDRRTKIDPRLRRVRAVRRQDRRGRFQPGSARDHPRVGADAPAADLGLRRQPSHHRAEACALGFRTS